MRALSASGANQPMNVRGMASSSTPSISAAQPTSETITASSPSQELWTLTIAAPSVNAISPPRYVTRWDWRSVSNISPITALSHRMRAPRP